MMKNKMKRMILAAESRQTDTARAVINSPRYIGCRMNRKGPTVTSSRASTVMLNERLSVHSPHRVRAVAAVMTIKIVRT